MKDEYISLYLTREELKRKISSDFNIPREKVTDQVLKSVEDFINTRAATNEHIEETQAPSIVKAPMIPGTYYHINVKRLGWYMLGALLDIFITRGIAMPTLASFGALGRTIGKLNEKNGEVCVYYQALELKKNGMSQFEPEDILRSIAGKLCHYPKFQCMYLSSSRQYSRRKYPGAEYRKRKDSNLKCSVTLKEITHIFHSLRDKAVFSETRDGKWKVES